GQHQVEGGVLGAEDGQLAEQGPAAVEDHDVVGVGHSRPFFPITSLSVRDAMCCEMMHQHIVCMMHIVSIMCSMSGCTVRAQVRTVTSTRPHIELGGDGAQAREEATPRRAI